MDSFFAELEGAKVEKKAVPSGAEKFEAELEQRQSIGRAKAVPSGAGNFEAEQRQSIDGAKAETEAAAEVDLDAERGSFGVAAFHGSRHMYASARVQSYISRGELSRAAVQEAETRTFHKHNNIYIYIYICIFK